MSEESPPPKPKPGSLRDRIAAFESKPAAAPPPAPRPKPGHVQWKPKTAAPASPPSSPDAKPVDGAGASASVSASPEHKAVRGGMSAADAKESIGMGGSLKERMAALKGRGAFAGPPPAAPPKPATDRPKWKPPPVVHAPEEEDQEQSESVLDSDREQVKSPVPSTDAGSEVTDSEKPATQDEEAEDEDEEERKRRAAIAARLARLGGARFGMGPPVFAPKPHTKKDEPSEEKSPSEEVAAEGSESIHSQADAPATSVDNSVEPSESNTESPQHVPTIPLSSKPAASSQVSLLSEDSASSARSPASMPAPTAPRRAGPPRRRPPKSPNPSTKDLPSPPSLDAAAELALSPRDETATPIGAAERDEKKLEDEVPAEEPAESAGEGEDATLGHEDAEVSPAVEKEAEPEEAPEPEEDEAARRKRIADRIAKSGGFNPFAPIPRRTSTSSEQAEPETPVSPPLPATAEDEGAEDAPQLTTTVIDEASAGADDAEAEAEVVAVTHDEETVTREVDENEDKDKATDNGK